MSRPDRESLGAAGLCSHLLAPGSGAHVSGRASPPLVLR